MCLFLLFVGFLYHYNVFLSCTWNFRKHSYYSFSVSNSGVWTRTFKTGLVMYFEVLATTICDLARVEKALWIFKQETKFLLGRVTGPSTTCQEDSCSNQGVCLQQWDGFSCDCSMTSFSGPLCNDREYLCARGLMLIFATVWSPGSRMGTLHRVCKLHSPKQVKQLFLQKRITYMLKY